MSDYDALKRAGYSAAKAIEIIYDARRGCRSAQYLVDNIARENGSYGSPEGVQSRPQTTLHSQDKSL